MVGQIFIPNVTFTPGENVVTSRVYIDTKAAMSNIVSIIHSQRDQLYHGKLGLKVSGKSVVYNGENIAYYENALSKLQLYSSVPISPVLSRTVGGLASRVPPGNLRSLLDISGVMAILHGNGVDLARLTTVGAVGQD